MNTPEQPIDGMEIASELGIEAEIGEAGELFDAVFSRFLQAVEDPDNPEALVMQFLSMATWMKDADEARKRQNAKLMRMSKAWEAVRARFTPKLLDILSERGVAPRSNPEGRKITTLIGTLHRQQIKEWSASLNQGSEHSEAALQSMVEIRARHESGQRTTGDACTTAEAQSLLVEEGYVELRPHLTEKGKEKAKQLAVALLKDHGEIVTWARVTAPGWRLIAKPAPAPAQLNAAARRLIDGSRALLQVEEAPATEITEAPEGLAND